MEVKIKYTNYRGETSDRRINPISIWFGATDYHTEKQWLLKAFDIDKKEYRDFAMCDIHMWGALEKEDIKINYPPDFFVNKNDKYTLAGLD